MASSCLNTPVNLVVIIETSGLRTPRVVALILRVNQHGNPFWLQNFLDAIGHLRGQGFLCLQAMGKAIKNPRQFGNANNAPVGHIGNMGNTQNRHQMMFAMAFHPDIAKHHHIVIAFDFFKGARQHLCRIFVIAAAEF